MKSIVRLGAVTLLLLATGCSRTNHVPSGIVEPPTAEQDASGTGGRQAWQAPAEPTSPEPTSPEPEFPPVRPGTSCEGLGSQVTDSTSRELFARRGDVWSRTETWACGCPSGPVFVLLYEADTAPLRVRICADPSRDTCEAICRRELRWDLAMPLREAGASDVLFVDPE